MKEGQKDIFYMAADSLDAASSAPFVERLVQRDYEVGPLPPCLQCVCASACLAHSVCLMCLNLSAFLTLPACLSLFVCCILIMQLFVGGK